MGLTLDISSFTSAIKHSLANLQSGDLFVAVGGKKRMPDSRLESCMKFLHEFTDLQYHL